MRHFTQSGQEPIPRHKAVKITPVPEHPLHDLLPLLQMNWKERGQQMVRRVMRIGPGKLLKVIAARPDEGDS